MYKQTQQLRKRLTALAGATFAIAVMAAFGFSTAQAQQQPSQPSQPSMSGPSSSPSSSSSSQVISQEDPQHTQDLADSFSQKWERAFKKNSEQFSNIAMDQAQAIARFMDAQSIVDTTRLFGEMKAEAAKDYQPDVQMCTFGTAAKSMADSDSNQRTQAGILNETLMQRDTMNADTYGHATAADDYTTRANQFKQTYCSLDETAGEMEAFCKDDKLGSNGGAPERVGADIDFTRLDTQNTLDIDFTDAEQTKDEEDVMALMKNLISNKVMDGVKPEILERDVAQSYLSDVRSVQALRSVPRYSLSAIIAMRAKSAEGSAEYLHNIVKEMGVPEDSIKEYLGENPSHFAQMDILTSKLYQNPEFYINLQKSEENVKRTGAALQAIELMQSRERYEASLRREMLVSLLLEMKIREEQAKVNDRLTRNKSTTYRPIMEFFQGGN